MMEGEQTDKQVEAGGRGGKKCLYETLFFDFEGFPFSKLLNVEVVYSLV